MGKGSASRTDDSGNGDEDAGGVQAVDTAVRILLALIDVGAPLMLKTVAERADMHPSKAHRYLVSFCRAGLAERDSVSGGYRLGPMAVGMGLAAVRQLNVVREAGATLAQLRDELGFTCALAVWGTAGPTFVRFEETNDALIISGRPGSVLPVLTSSTGRMFGAFLPRTLTQAFIDRELAGVAHPGAAKLRKMAPAEMEAMFEDVRSRRVSRVQGDLNQGIHGLSAPVLDHAGTLVGVITLMGSAGLIDVSLDGRNARRLAERADEVSRRMGWNPS